MGNGKFYDHLGGGAVGNKRIVDPVSNGESESDVNSRVITKILNLMKSGPESAEFISKNDFFKLEPYRAFLNERFSETMQSYWTQFHEVYSKGETQLDVLLDTYFKALPAETALQMEARLDEAMAILNEGGTMEEARNAFSFDCDGAPWSNFDTLTPDIAIDYKRKRPTYYGNPTTLTAQKCSEDIEQMVTNIVNAKIEYCLEYDDYYSRDELERLEYHLVLDAVSPVLDTDVPQGLHEQYYNEDGTIDYQSFVDDIGLHCPTVEDFNDYKDSNDHKIEINFDIWVIFEHDGEFLSLHLTRSDDYIDDSADPKYYAWDYTITKL